MWLLRRKVTGIRSIFPLETHSVQLGGRTLCKTAEMKGLGARLRGGVKAVTSQWVGGVEQSFTAVLPERAVHLRRDAAASHNSQACGENW